MLKKFPAMPNQGWFFRSVGLNLFVLGLLSCMLPFGIPGMLLSLCYERKHFHGGFTPEQEIDTVQSDMPLVKVDEVDQSRFSTEDTEDGAEAHAALQEESVIKEIRKASHFTKMVWHDNVDVIVEVYKEQCQHCARLLDELMQVTDRIHAEGLAHRFLVMKIDGQQIASSIPKIIGWGHGFPILLYFRAGQEVPEILLDPIHAVKGPRTSVQIWDWIQQNSSFKSEIGATGFAHGNSSSWRTYWFSCRKRQKVGHCIDPECKTIVPEVFEHPRDAVKRMVLKFDGNKHMRLRDNLFYCFLACEPARIVIYFFLWFISAAGLLAFITAPFVHDFISLDGSDCLKHLKDDLDELFEPDAIDYDFLHSDFMLRLRVSFHIALSHMMSLSLGTEYIPRPGAFWMFVWSQFQVILGLFSQVVLFAAIVKKLEQPRPAIIFSPIMLVTKRDDQPVLLVRLGNLRCNKLIDLNVSFMLLQARVTKEGEPRAFSTQLPVNYMPIIHATNIIEHQISAETSGSELHHLLVEASEAELRSSDIRFAIVLSAYDTVHGETMHASYSWTAEHVVLARNAEKLFADVIIPGKILSDSWVPRPIRRYFGWEPKKDARQPGISSANRRLSYTGSSKPKLKGDVRRGKPRVMFENIGVLVANTDTTVSADVGFCF